MKEEVLEFQSEIKFDIISSPYSISKEQSPKLPTARETGIIAREKFLLILSFRRSTLCNSLSIFSSSCSISARVINLIKGY